MLVYSFIYYVFPFISEHDIDIDTTPTRSCTQSSKQLFITNSSTTTTSSEPREPESSEPREPESSEDVGSSASDSDSDVDFPEC